MTRSMRCFRKRWKPILLSCFLLISASIPVEAQERLPLRIMTRGVDAQQLSPADVDLEHFESHSLLFTLNIENPNAFTVQAILKGSLIIRLDDGTNFIDPPAAEFITDPFDVPPGLKVITNLSIGRSGEITTKEFRFEENAKSRIQDVSLGTGQFPAGLYIFEIGVIDVALDPDNPVGTDDVKFTLRNFSRVELRSPRDGEITNDTPLFEFFHEGQSVNFVVCEKMPGESREDAIDRRPAMVETELMGQNSFLYAGGRPLEQGKEYVWRITSMSRGSGGSIIEVPSTIGLFVVQSGMPGMSQSELLNQLILLFGDRYPGIFEAIRRENFTFTGEYTLNGRPVSIAELLNILNDLRASADDVELGLE